MKIMLWIAGTLGLLAVFALWLPHFVEGRFYYPRRGASAYTPQSVGLAYEDVYFSSVDGARLHGWFIPALGKARGLVLQVHGNAGRLENHLDSIRWLPEKGYAVFAFDYRAYGLSEDKTPTPKALMEDTQSAIAYLQSRKDMAAPKLWLLAQSLGGNNAIAAKAHGKIGGVAGMVLDSTFYSYQSIVNDKIPGAGIFISDRYSASQFIAQLAPLPLFFLHGDQDRTIPWQHSQKLYELASAPKQIRILPGVRHMGALESPEVRAAILRFFEQPAKITVP
ncbi:MAG: alpha/beta hydrolase [Candidatus Accumulibacter sp.]|jgi:alpha-beta hydrolase superfamily lysophospholipase|nr:alpha/beta hydrolase [Accumulibacter sp.]